MLSCLWGKNRWGRPGSRGSMVTQNPHWGGTGLLGMAYKARVRAWLKSVLGGGSLIQSNQAGQGPKGERE